MSDSALAQDPRLQLSTGARALCGDLPESVLGRLLEFSELLQKWNRTYNLTAIRDPQKIVSLHLLDSLAVARYVENGRVLDVGSGGGFPGIPLAIARPGLQISLIDSNQKKTAFLRQAVATLGLANVEVVCERVEHWHPGTPFHWVVSRAFAELRDFVAAAAHLLAPGGQFAAMKGALDPGELERLPQGFRVRESIALAIPGVPAQRHLVLVERA